jgi:hypothetical protein
LRCFREEFAGRSVLVPSGPVAPATAKAGSCWPTYQRLADDLGGQRNVRLTYDRRRLELRSPLPEQEAYSVQLAQFVRVLAAACQMSFKCMGP